MKRIQFQAPGYKEKVDSVIKQFNGIYHRFSNLFLNSKTLPKLFDVFKNAAIAAIRQKFIKMTEAHPIFRGFQTSSNHLKTDYIVEKQGERTQYTIRFRHKAEAPGNKFSGQDDPYYHPVMKAKGAARGAYQEPINRLLLEIMDNGKKRYLIPSTSNKKGFIRTLADGSKKLLVWTDKAGNKRFHIWKMGKFRNRLRVPKMAGTNWREKGFTAVLAEFDRIKEKIRLSVARSR